MSELFAFRFSVVVPTFNRRDILLQSMISLSVVQRPWPCELIVVVDGSTDGSVDAARAVPMPYPTQVISQANQGAATARNRGAREARGEFILFLDDDMSADPRLLVEHDRALRAGADAVVGHIPLHPDSPRTLLTLGIERWARLRRNRLTRSGGALSLADLLTGQLSVRASTFAACGGFDPEFNAGGAFGGEDTDFLYRLLRSNATIRFAPDAVSYQRYVVTPGHYLTQWRQAGRADAALARKHPTLAEDLIEQHGGATVSGRVLRRLVRSVPTSITTCLARPVVRRAGAGRTDRATRWAFARVRDAQYWRGAHENGEIRSAPPGIRVLAYHSVEDAEAPHREGLTVSPDVFERQMSALRQAGFRFVGVPDLMAQLDGGGPPDRSILLTFDDGYESLYRNVAPILEKLGAPAVVFLVSSGIGRWNNWDSAAGGTRKRLLNGTQLRALVDQGWSLGAHSRSHAHLLRLGTACLRDEVAGCARELADAGLPVTRLFAYPYGEHDVRVRRAVRRGPYDAAFAVTGRTAIASRADRYAIPRIEVTSGTSPDALVALALAPPRSPLTHSVRRVVAGPLRGILHTMRLPGRSAA